MKSRRGGGGEQSKGRGVERVVRREEGEKREVRRAEGEMSGAEIEGEKRVRGSKREKGREYGRGRKANYELITSRRGLACITRGLSRSQNEFQNGQKYCERV
jgi:hypothetical protein